MNFEGGTSDAKTGWVWRLEPWLILLDCWILKLVMVDSCFGLISFKGFAECQNCLLETSVKV